MKNGRNRIYRVILLCLLVCAVPQAAMSATKVLSVPLVAQEQDNWCWAGSSAAVLGYFAKNISQCYIADFGWSLQSCCSAPAGCNYANSMYGTAGSIQGILKHWCYNSGGVASYLTFAAVQTQINADRPFIIRYGWTSGGGHFIVLRGYDSTKVKKVYLMNPWPGTGYGVFTYASVKSASDHAWTHTLRNIQALATEGAWKVTNTIPVISQGCGGYSGKCWTMTLSLAETAGGCGKVTGFYLDFYDEHNVYLGTQTQPGSDFPVWFNDCADPDQQLPRKTKFCGSGIWVNLGGRLSGWVKYTFQITCDSGTTKEVSKKIRLQPGAASVLDETEGPGAFGTPKSGR